MILKNTLKKIGVALLMLLALSLSGQEQEPNELVYKTGVTAKTIPLFAVDTDGNPVYDLDKKDIQLLVNGKTTPFQFLKYRFDLQEETTQTKKTVKEKDRRVIFIIVDSMFNSKEGFLRTKAMISEFVRKRFNGNRFVILDNNPKSGLHVLLGPETDENKLMAAVDTLQWYPEKKRKQLFMSPMDSFTPLLISFYMDVAYSSPRTSPLGGFDPRWLEKKVRVENKRFRNKARAFSNALVQFKYVLQSISDPTLVFLISEGFSKEKGVTTFKRTYNTKDMTGRGAIREFSLYYLHRIIDGINTGGSVLYTINPTLTDIPSVEKVKTDGGALSMRYAAEQSGGKYFEGKNVESIVKDIKKYTAAYYELGFELTPAMGQRQNIRVTCGRKGIRLHTIRKTERERSYTDLETKQKKLFAYNVISGGSWSRVAGTVKLADYKVETVGKKQQTIIDVNLPENMWNRKVDVYRFYFDTKVQSMTIERDTREVKQRAKITFKAAEGKEYHFTVIEPSQAYCIFGDAKGVSAFQHFFQKLKNDELFQLSRVTFPFKQLRLDPKTGEELSSRDISKQQWEHTTFADGNGLTWGAPEVSENKAFTRLSGGAVDITIVFKKVDGEWRLDHSEDRSNYEEGDDQ